MKISFTGLSDKSFVENNTVGKGRIWRRDSGEGVDVYITKSPASACWDIFDIYTPEYDDQGNITLLDGCKDNVLKIEVLRTNNNSVKASPYKGIGTLLVKHAVEESIKKGFGGKLSAYAINLTENRQVTPTLFYEQLGFQFFKEELNKLMRAFRLGYEQELPEQLRAGDMFLSEENAKKTFGFVVKW